MADKEARGASLWTSSFDERTRTRILHVFRDTAEIYLDEISAQARGHILRDEGLLFLMDRSADERLEILAFLLSCEDAMVPTVIEAMALGIKTYQDRHSSMWSAPKDFEERVGVVLREHRLSYDFVDGTMIEFSSKELHEAVVLPTLWLLAGRSDLSAVESAYQAALEEISKGSSGDAVTDAGTALQELLTALGCEGNALGPLIGSARKKGLLAPHDSPMLDAVVSVLHWISADRSESGDAHSAKEPSIDDAWLIVHVVGAVILRLTKPTPRRK